MCPIIKSKCHLYIGNKYLINGSQIIELYELFNDYNIQTSHSHTIIDDLLFEITEMNYDDNFSITEWKKFLKNYVENGYQRKFEEFKEWESIITKN